MATLPAEPRTAASVIVLRPGERPFEVLMVERRGRGVFHAWVTPDQALRRAASGDWAMILPTLAHLRWLSRRFSIEDALASAAGADGRTLIRPRLIEDGSLVPVHLPADRR